MKFFNYASALIVLNISIMHCLAIGAEHEILDPLKGRKGFLECMGYAEEVVLTDLPVVNYENYDNYETFGKDILLIINYNHDHYKNSKFIKALYKPFFPNIVFFGPKSGNKKVHAYDAQYGAWGHRAIAIAMEMYPNFKGYLFLEDDCTLHFWNLVRFDKNKIWIGDHNNRRVFYFGEQARWSNWNHSYYGSDKLEQALQKIPGNYRAMLEDNLGPNRGLGGMADVVYFPARFKDDVIALANLFAQEHVFIEIAIPTIACCLDLREDWESLHGRWAYVDNYNPYLDFVHPMKFSKPENRDFVKNLFESTMREILKMKHR